MNEKDVIEANLLATVELIKLDDLSDNEFFEIRREVSMMITSVGGRVITDPLSDKSKNMMTAAFEISPRMQKIVEDVLLEGLKITAKHKGVVTIEQMPAVSQ